MRCCNTIKGHGRQSPITGLIHGWMDHRRFHHHCGLLQADSDAERAASAAGIDNTMYRGDQRMQGIEVDRSYMETVGRYNEKLTDMERLTGIWQEIDR